MVNVKPGTNIKLYGSASDTNSLKTAAKSKLKNTDSLNTTFSSKLRASKSAVWVPAARSRNLQTERLDYSTARAYLNQNNNAGITERVYADTSTKFTGLQQKPGIMDYMSFGMGILNTANQVGAFGNIAGSGGNRVTESGTGLFSGDSKKVSGDTQIGQKALEGMSSANDSVTLRGAIQSASDGKIEMQNNIEAIESELNGSEQKEGLKAKLETTKTSYEKVKVEYDKAAEDLKNASGLVKQEESNLKVAQTRVEAAQGNVTSAESIVSGLEAKLAQATDPKIKAAIEAQLTPAKNALEAAKKELVTAQDNEKSAQGRVDNAIKKETACNKALNEAEEGKKSLAEEYNTAKDNYEKGKAEITAKESLIAQYKKDIQEVTSSVEKQKKRLEQLEKEEAKELKQLNNNLSKIADKAEDKLKNVDASDGMDKKETRKKEKADNILAKAGSAPERQKELMRLADINMARQKASSVPASDGTPLKEGTLSNGEKVYFIGDRLVTSEEYMQKLAE